MEREYYRRHAARRPSNHQKWPEPKRDIREILLKQCVASGIVLSVVLLVCLIQTPFTQTIRQDLKTALSRQTTVEEAKQSVGRAMDSITNVENTVKTIMGGTPEEDAWMEQDDVSTPVDDVSPLVDDTSAPDDDISTEVFNVGGEAEFRIDEDILDAIQNRKDTYTDR